MERPTPDALRRAAVWLDAAIGTDGSAADVADLAAVVAWLHDQADASELRAASREAGIPVGLVRRRLLERMEGPR